MNHLFAAVFTLVSCHSFGQIEYPIARTEPFDTTIYDFTISDPYFWMSRSTNEGELLDFAQKQVHLTRSLLDSIPNTELIFQSYDQATAPLQKELWNLRGAGSGIYYKRDFGDDGSWLCHKASIDGPEEKIMTKVSIHGQRYAVKKTVYAHNAPLIALMLVKNGEESPHIRIFNTEKRIFLEDSIAPVMFNDSRGVSMAWMPDDSGLLYTQAPATDKKDEMYYRGKIKLHIPESNPETDQVLFGVGVNPAISLKDHETPYKYSFRNSPYLIVRIRAGNADNYAFAVHSNKINGSNTPWNLLRGYVNLGEGFDARGEYLYAATKGKPRYEISRINMETGATPEIFLPQQVDVLAPTDVAHSSGIVAGKNALYVLIRRVGDMEILKVDYKSKTATFLHLPAKGAIAELSLLGDDDLLFVTGAANRGMEYLRYDFSGDTVLALPFGETAYDASAIYAEQVIQVPSRDGKQIPVSLIYKAGLNIRNKNPLLIEAYGNSGASTDLFYNPGIAPWLDNDGVYAYAHVRGGGELGDDWIRDGQYPNKMNSINDVVDVAEYFIRENYTAASKQLVMGGSAGSFLVGMSINQRPDLFAGGLFLSGLPDIATYRDRAFARESKSVGTLDTKDGFLANYAISSYYQIPENRKLPAMFVAHGATDYILSLHPAARYVAKLQQMQRGERPILLLVDWETGHSGSEMQELYMFKFALWQTGHPDFQIE